MRIENLPQIMRETDFTPDKTDGVLSYSIVFAGLGDRTDEAPALSKGNHCQSIVVQFILRG